MRWRLRLSGEGLQVPILGIIVWFAVVEAMLFSAWWIAVHPPEME